MPNLASKLLKQTAKTDDGRRFFRFYGKEDPMSDFGHAMFREASDPYEAQDLIGHYGKNAFELDTTSGAYPHASELKKDILKAIANEFRSGTLPAGIEGQLRDGLKARDIAAAFNPRDIVDSAGAYDDADYLTVLYNNVIEPKGLRGVKTEDGAISFYPEDINHFARKEDGWLPDGLKSALPIAAAGGLMAGMSPSDASAIQRIRSMDGPIEDAWNPLEAFAGGLGGGLKAAAMGVLPDGAMDWAINRIGGLMSGGK